jgi:thioredoxin 1
MTLMTNLEHVETAAQFNEILENNENVIICCGRMGPMCVPVYAAMEELREEMPNIKFYDMLFDIPDAYVIRNAPECAGFMGLPFTMYYKNGKVVKATSSIQSKEQVKALLDENFS